MAEELTYHERNAMQPGAMATLVVAMLVRTIDAAISAAPDMPTTSAGMALKLRRLDDLFFGEYRHGD